MKYCSKVFFCVIITSKTFGFEERAGGGGHTVLYS